ncbi:DUF4396 domain-containing protein [Kaarinaea lacus]
MQHQAHVHNSTRVSSAHQHHGDASASSFKLATQATIHCLIGCAIGELAGLTIGVSLGFNPWLTMALATVLGFASGYTLGLWPLVREGKGWIEAFRIIWLGETISIAVMELVMNATDYYVGGVQTGSIFSSQFWLGYLLALPAGFVAAWPVNYWLLKRNVKQHCH